MLGSVQGCQCPREDTSQLPGTDKLDAQAETGAKLLESGLFLGLLVNTLVLGSALVAACLEEAKGRCNLIEGSWVGSGATLPAHWRSCRDQCALHAPHAQPGRGYPRNRASCLEPRRPIG